MPSTPIPVLITSRELNLGGVERDVSKIAMGLDRSRFQPHVATFFPKGLRYDELRAGGVPIVHVPCPSVFSAGYLRSLSKLRAYIKEHRIQIVHSYDASGVLAIPAGRLAGAPVVIGSQLSYRGILDWKTQALLRLTDRLADAVLVNCEAIRRYMIADEHVADDRVELCYNGVLTKEFFPARQPRPEPLSGASLVIGTVCVLRPEKALTLLQNAFAKVSHLKPGLKLAIVGSGPLLSELQTNAARLGITQMSVFSPATRDVVTWMRGMDVFVLPSYSEAFSNSLLEAMASGCVPVGSRVGGTPELIGANEERGLLFKSGDCDELAAKLARVISDDSLRARFAASAVQFVQENLTIEIAVAKTSAMYDRWLERKTQKNTSH